MLSMDAQVMGQSPLQFLPDELPPSPAARPSTELALLAIVPPSERLAVKTAVRFKPLDCYPLVRSAITLLPFKAQSPFTRGKRGSTELPSDGLAQLYVLACKAG